MFSWGIGLMECSDWSHGWITDGYLLLYQLKLTWRLSFTIVRRGVNNEHCLNYLLLDVSHACMNKLV